MGARGLATIIRFFKYCDRCRVSVRLGCVQPALYLKVVRFGALLIGAVAVYGLMPLCFNEQYGPEIFVGKRLDSRFETAKVHDRYGLALDAYGLVELMFLKWSSH